jgi:cytochrome c biogenesis protein CcdA
MRRGEASPRAQKAIKSRDGYPPARSESTTPQGTARVGATYALLWRPCAAASHESVTLADTQQ